MGDRARIIGQALPTGRIKSISDEGVARLEMDYGWVTMPRVARVEDLEHAAEAQLLLELPA